MCDAQYVDLTIADVMTRDPICFTSIVSVGHVYDTLKDWKHHSFPIVDVDADGEPNYILLGTVPRKVSHTSPFLLVPPPAIESTESSITHRSCLR
jgi:CBS domain-containing protein